MRMQIKMGKHVNILRCFNRCECNKWIGAHTNRCEYYRVNWGLCRSVTNQEQKKTSHSRTIYRRYGILALNAEIPLRLIWHTCLFLSVTLPDRSKGKCEYHFYFVWLFSPAQLGHKLLSSDCYRKIILLEKLTVSRMFYAFDVYFVAYFVGLFLYIYLLLCLLHWFIYIYIYIYTHI